MNERQAHLVPTGFVGCEVLRRALDRPRVDRVNCLSRRALEGSHAQLTVHIQRDFGRYGAVEMDALRDITACIWADGDGGEPGA